MSAAPTIQDIDCERARLAEWQQRAVRLFVEMQRDRSDRRRLLRCVDDAQALVAEAHAVRRSSGRG